MFATVTAEEADAERLTELAKIITHEEAVPMPVEAEIAIRLHKAATEAKE